MSEISEKEIRQPISWGLFAVTFLGSPLLFTAITYWSVITPISLLMGGPAYVLIGLPLAVFALRQGKSGFTHFALLGFLANLAVIVIALVAAALGWLLHMGLGLSNDFYDVPFSYALLAAIFGSMQAPLWAGGFGWAYARASGQRLHPGAALQRGA